MPTHPSKKLNSMEEGSHNSDVPVDYLEFAAKNDVLREVYKAGSSRAIPANDGLVASSNQGVAMIADPSKKPTLKLSNSHSNVQAEMSEFLPILPGGKLNSDGASCHILKPCNCQLDKAGSDAFEVHLSDICQRRFVMFDQSGSKNQMIFHPSMVGDFSGLLRSPWKITNLEECKSERNLEEVLGDPLSTLEPNFLSSNFLPGWQSILFPSKAGDMFQPFPSSFAEGSNADRVTISLSKENSEDLDALLWSDDELSSEGRSTSHLTWSDAQAMIANVGTGVNVEKKRKACAEAETDSTATETDSTATSMDSTPRKVIQSTPHSGGGSGYGKELFAASDLSLADEESSNGSTKNFVYKSPSKKTRKGKIHSTLQLLRSIIPGALSMDAACLLGEAVQYVKNLQVEVEKLEDTSQSSLFIVDGDEAWLFSQYERKLFKGFER